MLEKIVFLLIDILGEITQLRILFTNILETDDKKVLAKSAADIILSKTYLKNLIDNAEVLEIDR